MTYRNTDKTGFVKRQPRRNITGHYYHTFVKENREEKSLERYQQMLSEWNKNSSGMMDRNKR